MIQNPGRGEWKANGAAVTRLAKAALRRLPDDPGQLGDILHGLGEIAARSDLSIVEALIDNLSRRRSRRRLSKVFAAAFAREAKTYHPVRLDAVAFVQWLSKATTNWDTFTLALSYVKRGPFIGVRRYGLAFAARVVLTLDPRTIDDCIKANPNRQRLATIGSAALAMVFLFDGKPRPAALLRSRNAAIRSIGAAALVSSLEIMGPPIGFRDCRALLVAGGIAPSDATWITGLRIKDAIHQQYRWRTDARMRLRAFAMSRKSRGRSG